MATPIEPSNESVQGGNGPDADSNAPGPNPAWNEALSIIPEAYHGALTDHFKKWDQAANSRVESVNSQLANFEPYQRFVEHGITDQELEQGLRLMYEINNNPENVYKALADAYKFGGEPQQPSAANANDGGDNADPLAQLPPEVMQQLGQQGDLLQTVAQLVLNDANAKQAAAADQELDAELNSLKEKVGDFDERYVLAMMQNGMSAEEAGQAWVDFKQANQPQAFAPQVFGGGNTGGGGAGLPSNAIDPTKLDNKGTRNLVVQMLQQAANQR